MNEYLSYKILFMLSHGFNKVAVYDSYVIADDNVYPFTWLENDYIFYNKICEVR